MGPFVFDNFTSFYFSCNETTRCFIFVRCGENNCLPKGRRGPMRSSRFLCGAVVLASFFLLINGQSGDLDKEEFPLNQNKSVYIFLGAPGAGKGSLSKICVEQLGWVQLSTGDLCRKHIGNQTEIGKQIESAIKSGKLVTDDLIVQMVDEWLDEYFTDNECVIFDGFPRTVAQAEALERLLKDRFSFAKTSVVKLLIDDDQVVARLTGRYICGNDKCQSVYSLVKNSGLEPKQHMVCDACLSELIRRSDDTEASIRERLRTYYQHENGLVDFYEVQGRDIVQLSVNKPLNVVFNNFKKRMHRTLPLNIAFNNFKKRMCQTLPRIIRTVLTLLKMGL